VRRQLTPQIQPRAPRGHADADAVRSRTPRRGPQSASRPCLPPRARTRSVQVAQLGRFVTLWDHQQRTHGRAKRIASSIRPAASAQRPATPPPPLRTVPSVSARARAHPRVPRSADGRDVGARGQSAERRAQAHAQSRPSHRIASHGSAAGPRARGARAAGGTGGRGWQAQFKKNQNKKKGQSKGGAKPGGEADGKASAAGAGVNSGERVQRVTAAHGSRRGAACCSQQPARAGRFRLRFIIGARTFSAQQALQRGGLGILFPTFSSPPVPNPLALFSLQYLWPVGGSKNRCVPAGGALSSRRSRPRPSKNPGRACCRCAGRIEEMGVTRHQQAAEHLDLESSPQQ
jgi:hypothetical protein